MAKYLEDKRRRIQGQHTGQVQTQPVQYAPKAAAPVQTQAAAPVSMQKQSAAPAPQQKQAPQNPSQKQTAAPVIPAAAKTTGGTDVVTQAQSYLNQQLSSYNSKYGSQITDLVAQLQNRPAFEYDVNTDPLYLQLRDIWKQDGLMAMEDTMGQAAQLTGGYGNSHAQTAGQQVYNGYLRQVNEMVPQLKEAARADYDADTDALLRQYSMLMEQDSQGYARYMDELNRQYQMERDAIADKRYDQEWQYQLEQDALANERYDREWEYQLGRDQMSDQRYDQEWQYQLGRDQIADQRYQDEWAYQQGRDQIADQRYQDELAYGREQDAYGRQQDSYDRLLELIIATGYQPSAAELAAAGMSEAEAKAWRGYYTAGQTVSGSGGSGGGGGGSRGSSGGSSGDPTGDPTGDSTPIKQNTVPSPLELGDPLRKEDYTHVYAKCTVYAGNGAPASELAAYIKQALKDGSITKEQYNTLMKKFGGLVDSGKGSGSSGSGGKGSGNNNRYNAFN